MKAQLPHLQYSDLLPSFGIDIGIDIRRFHSCSSALHYVHNRYCTNRCFG